MISMLSKSGRKRESERRERQTDKQIEIDRGKEMERDRQTERERGGGRGGSLTARALYQRDAPLIKAQL